MQKARINDFYSGRFFCITKTTFTLRKIDLHIEQAVGHKFASRWRFLETVVRVSQRKLRVYLDKICAQAKPVRVQAKH